MGNMFSCEKCIAKQEVTYEHWPAFANKMQKEGLSEAAIGAFKYNYET